MNTGLISVRYARALLEFAKETNSVETVYDEAKMLTLMFSQMSELRVTLENPVLSTDEKRRIILNAAGGKTSETIRQFTDLLLNNHRENQVHIIMLKFMDMYRKYKKIHYGKLITAIPIDKATEEHLTGLIINKVGGTLELEKKVDPNMLGGFTLEVEGLRLDASIAGQLNRIKKEYIEKNRRIV